MRISILSPLAAALLACACATQDDACVERRTDLAFNQPSPWGPTPAELSAHVEGPRSGAVQWLGGGDLGELTPASGEAELSITTVLDPASAVGVELEHVGPGRLACVDSLELRATVTIQSSDGALAEQLELNLVGVQGEVGGQLTGEVALQTPAGSLSWAPASDDGELFMRLSWIDDADHTVRGWLIWADASETSVDGDQLQGAGRVLAQFEATTTLP